jgi:hypothetical protein
MFDWLFGDSEQMDSEALILGPGREQEKLLFLKDVNEQFAEAYKMLCEERERTKLFEVYWQEKERERHEQLAQMIRDINPTWPDIAVESLALKSAELALKNNVELIQPISCCAKPVYLVSTKLSATWQTSGGPMFVEAIIGRRFEQPEPNE